MNLNLTGMSLQLLNIKESFGDSGIQKTLSETHKEDGLAAMKYGLTPSTLHNYLQGNVKKVGIGSPNVLTTSEERNCRHLFKQDLE